MRLPRRAALAMLGLLASPVWAAAGKPVLPPFANAYEPRGVDERGIWMEADEGERQLRDSEFVIRDAALTAYVKSVLCRAVGADRCAGARIYVMRVAAFNANMMPNGAMQVWSGLLLRARDEAELAAVLGHEFAHFERRHGLAGFKHMRSMADIAVWSGFLGGAMGNVVSTAAIGSIFSYDRGLEQEADILGAQYVAAAGYDPQAVPDIWSRTMDEADATALGRRQRSHRYDRVAFFASHPTDLDRATYLRKLAGSATGETGEAAYLAAMKPWRAQFLADQLKLNDFGGTDYLLGQLAKDGWTEDLLFARAELYRTRGNPRDLVTAADLYGQAIALDANHAGSFRGLGLSLMRNGDTAAGATALRRYLVLRPGAQDAAMITTLIS